MEVLKQLCHILMFCVISLYCHLLVVSPVQASNLILTLTNLFTGSELGQV